MVVVVWDVVLDHHVLCHKNLAVVHCALLCDHLVVVVSAILLFCAVCLRLTVLFAAALLFLIYFQAFHFHTLLASSLVGSFSFLS